MFYNHNPNFVFILIPKTASRSLLGYLKNHFSNGTIVDHHSTADLPEECSGYPTTAIVRNPYDRACSAFWFTCKRHRNVRHRNVGQSAGPKPETLLDFLEDIRDNNLKVDPIYTYPMTWWSDKFDITHIVRFENLKLDLAALPFMSDNVELRKVNTTHTDKHIRNHWKYVDGQAVRDEKVIKGRPRWQKLVGKKEAELIQKIYKSDFEEFNYSMEK